MEEARRGRPVYVEPFGGSAAMLLALEPGNREIYNDADGRLADFFRALADDEALEKMKRYAAQYYESSDPKKRDVREPRDTEFISSCLEYLINGAATCETHAEFTANVLRLLKKEAVKR